ncbi:efflux RND transporter periplasmic adaptor subunit [Candidatus Nitrosacidococcus sp. I8]|uniref:efflux RND transporter periplasmic adaptor subunit n=1 Tax=Candidatus Nitrosacidococcus sp. I8 TaxID=2942908 RepID=UPI00222666B7|nr:efflux RND transporter periplasmic adaptor subunit [Candidatus Nitrosacidococcus sp. I8]
MIKRSITIFLVLICLVSIAFFSWKYYEKYKTNTIVSSPLATVATTQAHINSWQPVAESIGNLVAIQGTNVTNEIEGLITKINFKSGQWVEKGVLLVQLNDSIEQADLRGLIAQNALASVQLKRNAQLVKGDLVSQSDYDITQAQLESDRANVDSKRALIQKKHITAPFSGLLGVRQVNLGEYLTPGSPIVLLQALDPIYVDYMLPERYFSFLSINQKISIKVKSYPDRAFIGHITAIDPGFDPQTRNIKIRATLNNPNLLLRPGMFSEVSTLLPERKQALTVPKMAIAYNPYGEMIYVVEKQGNDFIAHQRAVRVRDAYGDQIEIVKGLTEGEQVIIAGQLKLHNGQKVKINNRIIPIPHTDEP